MIPKMSSQDFNKILEDCKEAIDRTRLDIKDIKDDINIKTTITDHEIEYTNLLLKEVGYSSKDDEYMMLSNALGGLYEVYSSVTHASFKREPVNIFNLKAINATEDFFRDEIDVSINGVKNSYYKNILKSDKVKNKKIFFEERKDFTEIKENEVEDIKAHLFNKNNIKLEFEVNIDRAVGISKFNLIEIDPYLMGSFDLASIEIYEEDKEKPVRIVPRINRLGKIRILLDKKYLFKKVVFNIEPNYKTVKSGIKIIPFGFKHIFFLEADFRTDSKAIIKYSSDDYIDFINNSVTLLTPFGKKETSIIEEGIKIYLDYKNNILENEHQPSEMVKNPIARNLHSIYFEVPLNKKDEDNFIENSISAIKFFVETR